MSEDFDLEPYQRPNTLRLTQFPAEMIARIAAGMEDEYVVANYYGYSDDEYNRIKESPAFSRSVTDKRNELEASGVTYRNKMKLFAEAMAEEVFQTAMSADSSFRSKLDAAEFFTKASDLMPKANAQAASESAPRFVVNINIPQVDSGSTYDPLKTIDPAELDIDFPEITFDMGKQDVEHTDAELHAAQESDTVPD